MENTKWIPFVYNGYETNIEVTSCGRVRRIEKHWHGQGKGSAKVIYGEIDFNKTNTHTSGYHFITIVIKSDATILRKYFLVHQIIAIVFLNHNLNDKNLVIDHINSNKKDNDYRNLKIVTIRENSSKEKSIKSGLPTGVHLHKRDLKYHANIKINNKTKYLGKYNTIIDARNAYLLELSKII